MPSIAPTGAESATLGGPGFRPRQSPHAAELGRRWAPFAVCSEVAPLRAVTLSVPGVELAQIDDPDAVLMIGRPDLATLTAERAALAAAYVAAGVAVIDAAPPVPPPPNFLFQRDLYWMTPEGAVLARMAAEQRAGEERLMAAILAGLGVPILLSPRGLATFEGADALWLNPHTVLLGVGRRTNAAAVAQIEPLLRAMGVRLRVGALHPGVQHTLGSVNLLDEGLAAVLSDRLHPDLRAQLHDHHLIELPADGETLGGRAMNFVTLSPGKVLMPADCPRTADRLAAHGVEVVTVGISQYLLAAGGMGCATGILHRA